MEDDKEVNNEAVGTHTTTTNGGGGGSHRRAHSDVTFRIPDDIASSDPLDDDIFNTYIDISKIGSGNTSGSDGAGGGGGGGGDRPRHRYSSSVDATSSGGGVGEIMEAKKAMPPDKLAELWTVDPKRAKRILANRQSAARSKERKARYILELERKVQTLQTEATTLSAQLTLYQRDTNGLSTENTELKLRLQAMEQQAQLRDALNEALKQEVERLRVATGEAAMHPADTSFPISMPYNTPTSIYPPHQHQQPPLQTGGGHSNNNHHFQLFQQMQQPPPPFNLHPTTTSDQIGRLQGLDIRGAGPGPTPVVKSEGASVSASESSSTF